MAYRSDSLRFIGRDGSMGLTRGRVYSVALGDSFGGYLARIYDTRTGYSVKCPYQSLGAFITNWEPPRIKRSRLNERT